MRKHTFRVAYFFVFRDLSIFLTVLRLYNNYRTLRRDGGAGYTRFELHYRIARVVGVAPRQTK